MYQPVVKGIVTVPRCLCGGDVTLPNYFKDTYKDICNYFGNGAYG